MGYPTSDIHYGGAIARALDVEGAAPRAVDRLMLEEQERVWALARNHLSVDLPLHIPRGVVLNGTGRKTEFFVGGFDPGHF